MPYGAMPSRLMPIDADGTIVGENTGATGNPVTSYPSNAYVSTWVGSTMGTSAPSSWVNFLFFPEARTCLGALWGNFNNAATDTLQGSNDTTNGADGTWESASWPSGTPINARLGTSTAWRDSVKPMTFTSSKVTVKFWPSGDTSNDPVVMVHIYGVKASGQTPDDILFLDGDTAFAEYVVDKDFGDRPLGTTVVKQFKLKNSSATKTANTIVVTCNDADFAISNDGVTYGTTFTVTSLGAGVSSAVFYIRNTTPAPGAALGPRQVRLSAAVGSYT